MENEVKEPAPKYNYISPEEYLEMERAAEEKHEYFDGLVYAMAGASRNHIRISRNVSTKIDSFLEGKECELFFTDLKVTTPSHNSYMYPDVVIVCGEQLVQDNKSDIILNPSVIIEVLSPSTRSIDKQRKFFFYSEIPSLKEYIMIDSQKKEIITSHKQPDGSWKPETIDDSDTGLFIGSINFRLPMEAIYRSTGL